MHWSESEIAKIKEAKLKADRIRSQVDSLWEKLTEALQHDIEYINKRYADEVADEPIKLTIDGPRSLDLFKAANSSLAAAIFIDQDALDITVKYECIPDVSDVGTLQPQSYSLTLDAAGRVCPANEQGLLSAESFARAVLLPVLRHR